MGFQNQGADEIDIARWAAQRLGSAQSRVSDRCGKWEKLSLETLITLKARMNRQMTLEFAVG